MRLSLVLLARGYYTSHSKKIKKEIARATQSSLTNTEYVCLSLWHYPIKGLTDSSQQCSNAVAIRRRRRRQDFWRRAGGTQSQGIQNSQQLTGGYFHDNGPSPHCSQSAKNLSCELLGHPKHSLWCRFCADETKQKHLVIFFSLGKKNLYFFQSN